MPLQRSFRGLSDHIGSFRGGNVTQELSAALQLEISGEDFLNPYEWVRNTATLTAQGQAIVQTVDADAMWRIRSIHVQGLSAAGNSQYQAVVNPDGFGLVGLENTTSSFAITAAGITGYGGIFFDPDPLVLKGNQNAQIGYQIQTLSAGTCDLELVVCRQRINL